MKVEIGILQKILKMPLVRVELIVSSKAFFDDKKKMNVTESVFYHLFVTSATDNAMERIPRKSILDTTQQIT